MIEIDNQLDELKDLGIEYDYIHNVLAGVYAFRFYWEKESKPYSKIVAIDEKLFENNSGYLKVIEYVKEKYYK